MVYNDDSTDWNICAKKIEIGGDKLKKSYDSKVCSFSNGRFKKKLISATASLGIYRI